MGNLGVALTAAVYVAAAAMVGRRVQRWMGWRRVVRVVEELEEGCDTATERLRRIATGMAVEMSAGLVTEGGSRLNMIPTHVYNLPTGKEKGIYYALDLDGADFRVLRVNLGGQNSAIIKHDVERKPIPQNLTTSKDLFDFIATSLNNFVERAENASGSPLWGMRELGFTFPFPVKQTSSSSGTLVKWPKEFSTKDMVGKDVVQCLQQSMSRKGLYMRVATPINDTVGTLALGHYRDQDTVVAVNFGAGTNACYLEHTDAIIKCYGRLTAQGSMVVNVEWGNFWSIYLPRTRYDDDDSCNPKDQGFEKLISGMYLGDIVRRVILRMSQESDMFGLNSSKLQVPFVLSTPMIAAMHEDSSPDLTEVSRVLKDTFEMSDVPLSVRELVVKVCDVVTRRAARLAAAGIVGVVKKSGKTKKGRTVVAVRGDLYTKYRMFREYLKEAMGHILGDEVAGDIVFMVAGDGSGIGAALLAATHSAVTVGSGIEAGLLATSRSTAAVVEGVQLVDALQYFISNYKSGIELTSNAKPKPMLKPRGDYHKFSENVCNV